MKAILILEEIPDACVDCPLADRDRICKCCFVTGNPITNTFVENEKELIRNKDCPLKPLPYKDFIDEAESYQTEEEYKAYVSGWDECLDEILGEE